MSDTKKAVGRSARDKFPDDQFLYAVEIQKHGGPVFLTVFEDGQACTVRLNKSLLKHLVGELSRALQ